jgi:hypothetical protein
MKISKRQEVFCSCLLILAGVAFASSALAEASVACTPAFTEKLAPVDLSPSTYFASSLAVSGTTLVVGTFYDHEPPYAGAAYVYEFDGASWIEKQRLVPENGRFHDLFGNSVAIDGDWILIGAPGTDASGRSAGAAYVFHFDGVEWVESQRLLASDGDKFDEFGFSVALAGGLAAVGAVGDEENGVESGSAYVFRLDGETWAEDGKVLAGDGRRQDHYGRAVAISPLTEQVLVGSSGIAASAAGAVYFYHHDGAGWVQDQRLVPPGSIPGRYFGDSMAVSGDVAVIGAHSETVLGHASGAVYVYRYDGVRWTREQRLLAADGGEADRFGWSVSIEGTRIAIGAHNDADFGSNSGSAYLFDLVGTKWQQIAKLESSDPAVDSYFGSAIALTGGSVLVGEEGDDSGSGAAHVFDLSPCAP